MRSGLPGTYAEYFRVATGFAPYPYQQRLSETAPDFLKVETGLGKTEGLVLGWDWRRRQNAATPRRLIYTLPMRSLVEQTATRLQGHRSRLAAVGITDFPQIDIVMGGDVGEVWFRTPEIPAIVIGTQDMLLSRALNRGYGMSRFQWPMTFGACNNDSYWVIDEVQLQGIGAITAAQLQAFRDQMGSFGSTTTTFASATIDTSLLETAEFTALGRHVAKLEEDDRREPRVQRIVDAPKELVRLAISSNDDIAAALVAHHRPGTLTLSVMNTVREAKELFRRVQRRAVAVECSLLHSQFRAADRKNRADELIAAIDPDGNGRIVIATQVVEAGIDVSAGTLFTEVAPWSSLVQRFGRCNRRGTDTAARIVWLDRGEPDKRNSLPYDIDQVRTGRAGLLDLTGHSVAPSRLPEREIKRGKGLVLRRPEIMDLFDTSPDLSGHDVDVSPFIREADEFNVLVFWREQPPSTRQPPRREELCPAPIAAIRDALKTLRAVGHGADIRIANQFGRLSHGNVDGNLPEWAPLTDDALRPGLQVWLRSSVGYYDSQLGFERVDGYVDEIAPAEPDQAFQEECDTIDGDNGSEIGLGVTITQHAIDTFEEAQFLSTLTGSDTDSARAVERAALWHDVGKAHDVFQKTMRANMPDCPAGLWAKSPRGQSRHERHGFRHELPGALAYLIAYPDEHKSSLIAFLIAAHHGKLRASPPALPADGLGRSARVLGNEDGDVIPSVELLDGVASPAFSVSLDLFRVASRDDSPTWVERVASLRDSPEYGPFRLAFLELLVRLADWRASEKVARSTQ